MECFRFATLFLLLMRFSFVISRDRCCLMANFMRLVVFPARFKVKGEIFINFSNRNLHGVLELFTECVVSVNTSI